MRCPDCKKKGTPATDGTAASTRRGRGTSVPYAGDDSQDSLGFEYRQVPRLYITLALMLSEMGMAATNIQMALGHMGVKVHVDTITRILEHYFEAVQKYPKTLRPPCVGDKWGCEGKHQKVRGRELYVTAIMCISTRFILALNTTPTKKRYDAVPLLRKARNMAGKVPRVFITDSLDQYHVAFKKMFLTLKGLRYIHIHDIHIRNLICNTNRERFNGGLAGHFKYTRGINKEESLIFRMAIIHHNYIRPHGGIMYRTPAAAAGMDIRGSNIWLTLIQNAAAAA